MARVQVLTSKYLMTEILLLANKLKGRMRRLEGIQ
jgi:hypothetical protein